MQVYPLLGAMTFVTSMCLFQLTRNVFMNPDVSGFSYAVNDDHDHIIRRINKDHRKTAVLENYEEGEKYAEHRLRKFLRTRPPEIMPTINRFFNGTAKEN
ncbi:hypothetical protein EJ110_NYTH09493 [Nymphaea thermarum]|nr:hypothetical protein EJ110_NYTH09493 [Nymphaea thermarum]